MDEIMFQHIIYALNKILLILRDGRGLNKRTIKDGGKIAFRLSRLIHVYVHKKNKENIPAEEFTERLVNLVDRAHTTFVGGIIPSDMR